MHVFAHLIVLEAGWHQKAPAITTRTALCQQVLRQRELSDTLIAAASDVSPLAFVKNSSLHN